MDYLRRFITDRNSLNPEHSLKTPELMREFFMGTDERLQATRVLKETGRLNDMVKMLSGLKSGKRMVDPADGLIGLTAAPKKARTNTEAEFAEWTCPRCWKDAFVGGTSSDCTLGHEGSKRKYGRQGWKFVCAQSPGGEVTKAEKDAMRQAKKNKAKNIKRRAAASEAGSKKVQRV